jgi:hypothetical protein
VNKTLKQIVEELPPNHIARTHFEVMLKYIRAITTSNPEKFDGQLFITGMSHRENGELPQYIYVCPALGADVNCTQTYQLIEKSDYTAKEIKNAYDKHRSERSESVDDQNKRKDGCSFGGLY